MLVLRALGLGDFLTGLPALRLVRSAFPDRRIVLAAPEPLRPLLELSGAADDLLASHELSPLRYPERDLELAIDMHGNGPASLALLTALRPRHAIGFAAATQRDAMWRADEHEVMRWIRLVRQGLSTLGITGLPDPGGVRGSVPVPDAAAAPGVTVVHPGAAARSRQWPPERFAAVARTLRDQGHYVVVTGGQSESGLVHQVAEASGAQAAAGLTLVELFALVARARLVICGDTGVAHIASNYGTPSVVLFGPVSPAVWGPPASPRHRVIWRGHGDGDPHGSQVDPALLRIQVADVLAGAGAALESGDRFSLDLTDHKEMAQ